MNVVSLIGRLTKDVEVRVAQTQKGENMTISRFSLAVDRKGKDAGADFINCVAFGKNGEFAEKYLAKGLKIGIVGEIRTGSYDGKDGKKVYTTDVIVNSYTFCESRKDTPRPNPEPMPSDGFMAIPEDVEAGELPWK